MPGNSLRQTRHRVDANKMSDASDDFLKKMEAGDFDGNLTSEIQKLSKEELEKVAGLLIEHGPDTSRLKP